MESKKEISVGMSGLGGGSVVVEDMDVDEEEGL